MIPLDRAVGDFVLWRRDDLPSYHLASVVEDRDLGATHLIRGRDLLPSTAAQVFLAPFLDAGNVRTATFLHHDLVVGPDGTKLSKSRAAAGPAISRDEATRERITGTARALGEPLGIRPPS